MVFIYLFLFIYYQNSMVIEETSTNLQSSLHNLSSLCCIGILFVFLTTFLQFYLISFTTFCRDGTAWLWPPKIFQISPRVYKKITWAPQKLISSPPNYFQQFFKSSSLIQLQIKQKSQSTSIPTNQPQIPNQTKFFSSKLKILPAQPNPNSKIPNQTKQKASSVLIV